MGILIGVFLVAIFMDWRFYRIPNVCTGAGILAGLIMTFVSESAAGVVIAVMSMVIV